MTKRDELPVPREIEALDDLALVGIKAVFIPYGYVTRKKGASDVLNPLALNKTLFKKFRARSNSFHAGQQDDWRRQ